MIEFKELSDEIEFLSLHGSYMIIIRYFIPTAKYCPSGDHDKDVIG